MFANGVMNSSIVFLVVLIIHLLLKRQVSRTHNTYVSPPPKIEEKPIEESKKESNDKDVDNVDELFNFVFTN